MTDGFDKYRAFYTRPPALVVEWHDDRSPAVGWLCIDSLRGGAAGGGTRMRSGGTREEAVFLAKTMGVKFRACGPDIGGGKSVIRFDASAPRDAKHGVLERWYRHIGPYLKNCYGTGGDVGVDEVSEATAITERVLGLRHVQEGIARGHDWSLESATDREGPEPKIARLKHGVEAPVTLADLPGPRDGRWMVADVVTGLGVAKSVEAYYKLRGLTLAGQRVIIEGFGAVGAFAGYYLERQGAIIVSTSTRNPDGTIRVASNPRGIDVRRLIRAREGTNLPTRSGDYATIQDTASGDELLNIPAEIYIPAAASHTTTASRMRVMQQMGVKVVSCGANNPFAYDMTKKDIASWVDDMLALQREADQMFAIIPDFIANCGMARTFNYLMVQGGKTDELSILADASKLIETRLAEVLKDHQGTTGLLQHAYEKFIP
jgi:glutamate dehydrogenase (NAD(P)+)